MKVSTVRPLLFAVVRIVPVNIKTKIIMTDYFKDYLKKVLLLPNTKIRSTSSQVLIETNDLMIRIKCPFSPPNELAFQVKRKTEHYFRTVIYLKKEDPNSWFSNAVRFVVQSIILNEKHRKHSGKPKEFAFSENYNESLFS